jgi:hypothetical protein
MQSFDVYFNCKVVMITVEVSTHYQYDFEDKQKYTKQITFEVLYIA